MKHIFPVLKMTCAACALSVEKAIRETKGVTQASVNFADSTALVEFDENQINPETIQESVRQIGYDILTEEEGAIEQAEEIRLQEFKQLRTDTIWAILLALPVFIMGMFFMDFSYSNLLMLLFSTPLTFWFGRRFFVRATQQIRHLKTNMDTLVALSVGVSYLFSLFAMFFPVYFHSRGIHAHVYFEASSVVIALILLGKFLEEAARFKTSGALKKLIELQTDKVTVVLYGGKTATVPLDQVLPGDKIEVKPGERIPLDGLIYEGESWIDESMMTGEPLPVLKTKGERILAGTINQNALIRLTAEKVGKDTFLARVIRMVQQAQGSKAPVQALVDKIAGVFVPVVMLIALSSFIVWLVIGGENGLAYGLLSGASVLIVACPCALGLATPTAIIVGMGKGAEMGILIKDATSLERIRQVDTIVLDKTGTITMGKPSVTGFHGSLSDQDRSILFEMCKKSTHPLSTSLAEYLGSQPEANLDSLSDHPGKGLMALFGEKRYFLGTASFLRENHIHFSEEIDSVLQAISGEPVSVVLFAGGENTLSVAMFTDQIKSGSKEAIERLRSMGLKVTMLTGDNPVSAEHIAKLAGIEEYQARLLPVDKAHKIKELQEMGRVVAMVGDGINDSAALAQADVGIAMGKAAEIAIDASGMTIVSSNLQKIPEAIRLSHKTVATIRQNLFWAFAYNVIAIPIAAGVLYPVNGFMLNPMIAGAAMALSSVTVVFNSLRLKWLL